MKRAFKTKQKTFFIIFKGLSINQATQIFLDGNRNPEKKSLYFRKRNFLTFQETETLKNFLYFRKWNIVAAILKNFLYFRREIPKSGKQTKNLL